MAFGRTRSGTAAETTQNEGDGSTLDICLAELKRLRNLAPSAFDDGLRILLERRDSISNNRTALGEERERLTQELAHQAEAIAGGLAAGKSTADDAAVREKTQRRIRVIEDELAIQSRALEHLAKAIAAQQQQADASKLEAWQRLQALAIIELDEYLELAQRANIVLVQIEETAPVKRHGGHLLERLAWAPFTPNSGGSGTTRLENWRAGIRQHHPHISLRRRPGVDE